MPLDPAGQSCGGSGVALATALGVDATLAEGAGVDAAADALAEAAPPVAFSSLEQPRIATAAATSASIRITTK